METTDVNRSAPWFGRLGLRIGRLNRDHLFALLTILPSIILLAIFVYGFIGQTLYWSLTDWRGLSADTTKHYIALQNYDDLFTEFGSIEPRFRQGLINTFFFTLFFLIGCLVLGFLLAVLLDQKVKGEGFFRTTFLFPMALSFAVTGTTWRWLFDPRGGINQLPTALGLDAWDFRWLNNRQAYTFNWGAMSDLAVGVLVMILLAVFVLLLIRRRFLAAIYYGVVMALILMWIVSDILTYDASAADSNMHGTFHWHDMLDFVSMVLVVAFLLVVVRLLWLGKRRAVIWFGIPAALLLVWYVTGGPERLPRLNIPEAELPYGFNLALVGVIIAAVWQLSGYTMAMYLAGIRGVPEELREAARVDGCNEFQVYTKVVLPLLSPITLSAAIVLGHISLKIFDLIFAMTGPDYLPVTVPGVQVYSMFRSNEFAKGSAIAIVLLIMVAVIIIPYLATSLRSEHEL